MSGPATYSFGADAVRYGSDLSGQNSAYFLQQSGGTAVVPADLQVKGDLQVDGTSALVGALTVGTSSLASPTLLNGTLAVQGASNFTGGAQVGSGLTVGGGLSVVSGNVNVTGSGDVGTSSLSARTSVIVGSTALPGGQIIGYDGAVATLPVNFPYGINGPASLTPQFRYIQIGADSGDGGVPTSPDGTQGGNNYWMQSYGGTELKAYINSPATSAVSVYIVVLPSDFFTGTIPSISTKYYGKTLLKLWLAIVINSSVTVQFRIGSVTGTQVGRIVLDGAVASGWTLEVLASQASPTGAGVAPLYYGLAYNVVSQSGGISGVPPT